MVVRMQLGTVESVTELICSLLVERQRVSITVLLRDDKAMVLVASIREF
jgi:hypothetical protein